MDKILNIQQKIGVLAKDKENPYFKSKYFDVNQIIEQLLPLLKTEGLTVIQPLTSLPDNSAGLATIVMDGEKEIVRSVVPLPKIEDPQKMGSAITYYRRYSLQSLFLLQAEDDDGNKAGERAYKPMNKKEREAYQAKNKADYEAGRDPLEDDVI